MWVAAGAFHAVVLSHSAQTVREIGWIVGVGVSCSHLVSQQHIHCLRDDVTDTLEGRYVEVCTAHAHRELQDGSKCLQVGPGRTGYSSRARNKA